MTTALNDPPTVGSSFYALCDAYLVKPIDKAKLLNSLRHLKLLPATTGNRQSSALP
jgi:hypothetical protein